MTVALGATCFAEGLSLAVSRPLRRFVWVPLATSLLAVALLLGVGYALIGDAAAWVVAATPDWLDWLGYVVSALLYVLGLVLAGWLVGFVAVLLASPFLGALAAGAERERFGDAPMVASSLAQTLATTLRREARKLRHYLPRLAVVFLITLTPLLNFAAPVCWFVFGAWMLAVQFVDYAAENRGLDFEETLVVLRRHRPAALAFGGIAALLLAVPFAALLVVPAAVCGGALLWRRVTSAPAPATPDSRRPRMSA